MVNNGYERQFVYVYGGVSPIEGELDWMICPKMNTERMGDYLSQVALAHPCEFIVMVIDGASSHLWPRTWWYLKTSACCVCQPMRQN